jgi:hypothetical protein
MPCRWFPSVALNNGVEMPILGSEDRLATWEGQGEIQQADSALRPAGQW